MLSPASAQGLKEILAPCAACFSRLKGTNVRLARSAELAARMKEIVRLPYGGGVGVININEFANKLLAAGLPGKLTSPLKGLKAAPYYGCLLSRGDGIIEGEDNEKPSSMDAAIRGSRLRGGGVEFPERMLRRRAEHAGDRGRRGAFQRGARRRQSFRRGLYRDGLPDVPLEPGHAAAGDK